MIQPGDFVQISDVWLIQQDRWTREHWSERRAAVMRVYGAWADLRDGETRAELSVPLSELRPWRPT